MENSLSETFFSSNFHFEPVYISHTNYQEAVINIIKTKD